MEKRNFGQWSLAYQDQVIKAHVPGDITLDLFEAGKIENPYFGYNFEKLSWITHSDFTYRTHFEITEEDLNSPSIKVHFKGIDLFSDVYINGHLLGSTEDMWLAYEFELKPYLKVGDNLLEVKMKGTLKEAEKLDVSSYKGTFNTQRILLRKIQCHFGWDWAPKIQGYGIWDDAYLLFGETHRINSVQVISSLNGNVSFFVELNYSLKNLFCFDLSVREKGDQKKDDTLVLYVSDNPKGELKKVKEISIDDAKNFLNAEIPNPELWWPYDLGDQPLYRYRIELLRDKKVVDSKEGRFAFRTVELIEEPKGDNLLGFAFQINGREVFIRGTNWVPVECFTGKVNKEEYEKLLPMAKEANINLIRVWGGGTYEKDSFYDLCDELGLLVWQDTMLACADIAEDNPHWVSLMLKETEHVIKRLRNHPSLIYWTGGNEKTGSFQRQISKGDFFVNYVLAGVYSHFDGTRPYRRQSPYSHSDIANDTRSGESHFNVAETALFEGVDKYRKLLSQNQVTFISESAMLGPNSVESDKKFIPEDHLWPIDDLWNKRLLENPYGVSSMDFAHRELFYAESLYGKAKNLVDFTAKGMLYSGEFLRAELEMARFNYPTCMGFANWMFTDIWPTGTWAILDYYREPKKMYYQLKKSYEPVLVSFAEDKDGITILFGDNQSRKDLHLKVCYGAKRIDGETLFEKELTLSLPQNGHASLKAEKIGNDPSLYYFAYYTVNGKEVKTLYSKMFWSKAHFESDYTLEKKLLDPHHGQVTIHANHFAKQVFLHFKDNYAYSYSDNYVDVEPKDSLTIDIRSEKEMDLDQLMVEDFASETK